MAGPYESLVERLEAIAADLDEIAFDELREASAARSGRPPDDKRLMQARRAVEKATRLLRDSDDGRDDT